MAGSGSETTGPAHSPLLSVSLVTRDGLPWLPGCLATLAAQTLTDFELLVHDNGSADGSADWLRQEADRLMAGRLASLSTSPTNLGYALPHDRHIGASRGSVVVLLNQDVELDAGFLETVTRLLEERPEVGAVQAQVRRLDGPSERSAILDTTGLVMLRDRRIMSRSQGEEVSPPGGPVWGVDGPVPAYRRAALLDVRLPCRTGGWEVLDRDFFSYKEDVDLAWRLARLGWQAWYEPAALAWHARSSGRTAAHGLLDVARANLSNPPEARALSWRNQRLMQIKNEAWPDLLRDLPWIAGREIASWAFVLLADRSRLRVVPDLVRALPWAMRKRMVLNARVRRGQDGLRRSTPRG